MKSSETTAEQPVENPQLATEPVKKARPSANEKFSKTVIKKLLQMNKNQLVNMIIQMSDYSEKQKTANIILGNALNEIKNKKASELEAQSKENV